MLNQTDLEIIKQITKEFFKKTSFDVEIEFLSQQELIIPINLRTDEPKILIGERGQTLGEIQRLLKAILRRRINQDFYIDLDINGYKKRKVEYLKELAKSIADEVSLMKEEKVLPSMPDYERRIIHLELSEREGIATDSVGRDPDRKVIIRPCP
ncbi:MAG: protein jag [Candidatus Nealsonbacteria bacterium]